jgi:hypothetical protein
MRWREKVAPVLQHGFRENIVDWHESGYFEALRPDSRLFLSIREDMGPVTRPTILTPIC